jgi:hypothetical protein
VLRHRQHQHQHENQRQRQRVSVSTIATITIIIKIKTNIAEIIATNIMNTSPTIKDITDLWNFRTAYFGWGFDIGVGIGFSAGLYYYLHNGTTEPLYVNEFMRTPFPNIHQSR